MHHYSIAPRIPPALSYKEVVSMGCWVDVLTGWWMEGARGQQEAELQSKGGKKYQKLNAKRAARVPGGLGGSLWRPRGAV